MHRVSAEPPITADRAHATPPGARAHSTVVVCTRGRGPVLRESLPAIAAALRPGDELLVVEAQTVEGREALRRLGDGPWRWLPAPQTGKSRQLNHAIRAAAGEVVVITDDDCLVSPGWVDAMATPFLQQDVGIAFGPVHGLSHIPGAGSAAPLPPGPAPAAAWRYAHGASMAVRRQAVLEVGGFDERLGPGTAQHGEEADLLLRMQAAGWRPWMAAAPAVIHMEWRSCTQHAKNLLVYERGGGAWVGAALRRDPRAGAHVTAARLGYQAGLLAHPQTRRFGIRALGAFAGGLMAGLRLPPVRFLPPPAVAREIQTPARAALLPWPDVRGRRCLVLGRRERMWAAELERRGARVVLAPNLDEVSELGRVDVVVADSLLAESADALALARSVASICCASFLSIEPIALGLSLAARRRPRVRVVRRGAGAVRLRTGASHRVLLETAGFQVQAASRPFSTDESPGGGGQGFAATAQAALRRAMLDRRTRRISYRALLARVGGTTGACDD